LFLLFVLLHLLLRAFFFVFLATLVSHAMLLSHMMTRDGEYKRNSIARGRAGPRDWSCCESPTGVAADEVDHGQAGS
jgi:hypothetical protein